MSHFWVEVNDFWFLNEPSKLDTKYTLYSPCLLLKVLLNSWTHYRNPRGEIACPIQKPAFFREGDYHLQRTVGCFTGVTLHPRLCGARGQACSLSSGATEGLPSKCAADAGRGRQLHRLCLNSAGSHFQCLLLCLPVSALPCVLLKDVLLQGDCNCTPPRVTLPFRLHGEGKSLLLWGVS